MIKFLSLFAIVLMSFTLQAQLVNTSKKPVEENANGGSLNFNIDPGVDNLLAKYKKANEGKQITGYRIQIYSGTRELAFNLRTEFMKKIPETQITVVYESPDFKTQVGNYRTKLEAEKAMETIWPLYKSAFVVKTMIDLPRLAIEGGSN